MPSRNTNRRVRDGGAAVDTVAEPPRSFSKFTSRLFSSQRIKSAAQLVRPGTVMDRRGPLKCAGRRLVR